MKRLGLSILALALTVSVTAFADDENITENNDTTDNITIISEDSQKELITYYVSLDDAINMAYENNAKIQANESEQYGNEISIKSAEISMLRSKKASINVTSNFDAYCVREGYYLDASKVKLELSQKENEQIRGSIAYEVTKAYYNYGLMQKLLNAAQNSYDLALSNQNVVNAQYSLGLIPQLDYENALITVEKAYNALESCKLNLDLAHEQLKILLNKDAEKCSIVITDEIEYEEFDSDVNKDIDSAMNTRYDLNSLKKSRDLAESYFDMSGVLTESSATYNQAYASFVKADYNYTNTCKLIALSIRGNYNSIKTTKAGVDTANLTYNMKLKEYDSAKLKYELGIITNLELTKTINDLYDAQVAYANAKLDYRLAVEKYKYETSIGL